MTLHTMRILLIVPVAKVAAVVSWLQANVGATSVPSDLGPALNATGLAADPITHRWCCGSWIDAHAKEILARLANLATVTPPTNPQWAAWTRTQKITWLRSVQVAMRTGYGIWVSLALNDQVWDAPEEQLVAMSLKVIS